MRLTIAWLIDHLPRWNRRRDKPAAVAAPAATGSALGTRPHPAARPLAEAIDVAIARGQWERADRLARDAARILHTSSRLTERVARLRLAQGRAEAALAIIESARIESASVRLLRAACLIELGRVAEAHLDLREWSRKSTAPLEARRLLALLERGSTASGTKGDRDTAISALLQNLRQIEDPQTLELLVIDAAAERSNELAEHWAQRLLLATRWHDHEDSQSIDPAMLLETLGLDAAAIERNTPDATEAQIEMLATELIAAPNAEAIIAVIVRDQEASPDRRTISLLYEACLQALDALPGAASVCESLARLGVLLGYRQHALHWASRGATLNPMSASLARLVNDLAVPPDDPGMSQARTEKAAGRRAA